MSGWGLDVKIQSEVIRDFDVILMLCLSISSMPMLN